MYYIIINPASKSGKGISIWRELKPIFKQRHISYKVMLSTHNGHITEFVKNLTNNKRNGSDAPLNLIILGGDGTINEALQGIRDFSKVNIGYIPTGSSNDLARDMNLPKKPKEILDIILDGKSVHAVDLGILTYINHPKTDSESNGSMPDNRYFAGNGGNLSDNRYFAVSSGIGFDAAVCQEALSSPVKGVLNQLKLGKLTYLGIALKQLISAKSVSCDLYLDDKPPIHFNRFLFIASMIHQYEGGGFKFCPGANAKDGILDLCVVGNIPKLLIFIALPTAFFGKHYIFPQLHHYQASRVKIKTSVPLWVHTDGEVPFKSDQICLICQKQKINFLN